MKLHDFTHRLSELYQPPVGAFTFVDVPEMKYMTINGDGNPDGPEFKASIKWLFSLAHCIKPSIKQKLGSRFVEPPLECLFWSDQPGPLPSVPREHWKWQTMIVVLEYVTEDLFQQAREQAAARLGPPPMSLNLGYLEEGRCVQTMHVGDYSGLADVCAALYRDFLPAQHLTPKGSYHEIYLNDPSRVAPHKRKVVIRQPIA